jgi:hypothetical protein
MVYSFLTRYDLIDPLNPNNPYQSEYYGSIVPRGLGYNKI